MDSLPLMSTITAVLAGRGLRRGGGGPTEAKSRPVPADASGCAAARKRLASIDIERMAGSPSGVEITRTCESRRQSEGVRKSRRVRRRCAARAKQYEGRAGGRDAALLSMHARRAQGTCAHLIIAGKLAALIPVQRAVGCVCVEDFHAPERLAKRDAHARNEPCGRVAAAGRPWRWARARVPKHGDRGARRCAAVGLAGGGVRRRACCSAGAALRAVRRLRLLAVHDLNAGPFSAPNCACPGRGSPDGPDCFGVRFCNFACCAFSSRTQLVHPSAFSTSPRAQLYATGRPTVSLSDFAYSHTCIHTGHAFFFFSLSLSAFIFICIVRQDLHEPHIFY